MPYVLAVHYDWDMLKLIMKVVQERFPDVIVDPVDNALVARNHCRAQRGDPFRAVIASRSIQPDSNTGRNDTEHEGMAFLESLGKFGHAGVPKILISSTESASLISRIRDLPNCQLLPLDDSSRFEDSLVKIITCALERSEEEPKQVKVVVSLNLAEQFWEYEVKGVGFPYQTIRTPLQINTRRMVRLVNRSRRVARNQQDDWEEELLDIGHELGELLLYENPEFLKELSEAKAKAGGDEKCSICFNIEKSVHPVVLEALTDPKEEMLWMLKEPIYRRLIRFPQAPMERTALFKGRSNRPEEFNALIIESPAEGAVDGLSDRKGHPLRLEQLHKLTDEANVVEEILSKNGQRVRRIGPKSPPAGSSFKSYVRDVLHEDHWDLVHYAGHSHYDEERGKGYLFFPGEFVEALDIEMLNTYLLRAQTRFIYLSGCQSSEIGFVFELARMQIPAVLGFRWPIRDEPAWKFAHKFYEELFRSRAPCLEKAFLATRCAMRDSFHQDKIWAAAMLILQDTD